MKDSLNKYHQIISGLFTDIITDRQNKDAIEKAAEIMAESVRNDRLIYLCGTGGHSQMHTEECFYRAGMLVQLCPMINTSNLLHGSNKSRILERAPGYARGLLEEYDVKANDVIIIVNAYGINHLTIDMAIEAKKKGLHVVGICSKEFGKSIPADHAVRHPNAGNLADFCDLVIDCKMPQSEAVIDVKGCEQKVAPTSSLVNIFTIQLLMLQTVELLAEKDKPKIWRSLNLVGGDEYNTSFQKEYGHRIKYLL